MVTSESYDAAKEWKLSPSFTEFHGRLFDLCLNPPTDQDVPTLERDGTVLTLKDIDSLVKMVELEFVASFTKELQATEVEDTQPHVFDVYLMKVTTKSITFQSHKRQLALCVPYKKQLVWWNGCSRGTDGEMWPMDQNLHVRKVASLSGSARVLQALWIAKQCSTSPLIKSAMNRTHLFSVPPPDTPDSEHEPGSNSSNVRVNESQQRAVDAISNFDYGFLCIQGPPGCGKTTTMVQMILKAMEQGKVVVTAPSNAAVANVALKLYETGHVKYPDLVVYGPNSDESVHFLVPTYRSERFQAYLEERDKVAVAENNETIAKQKMSELLQKFGRWLHLDEDDWCNIREVCHIIPVREDGSMTAAGWKIQNELLAEASVIFCTLNSVGSATLQEIFRERPRKSRMLDDDEGSTTLQEMSQIKNITTLMLDEGGQCTEAEFFLATTCPGIQRIVVMGDPKQLPPTVINPDCARAGFGMSFLGQVFKVSPNSVHLLNTQYRMDPEILEFPNRRFYQNRIRSGDNVLHRSPHVEQPFKFVDTGGQGREEKVQFSWQNQYEVATIAVLLRKDTDICRLLETQQATNEEIKIIIISPYKSQVDLLKSQVRLPTCANKASLMISTVDSFQGQEGDIVILSTVRTKAIGFVDDPQRLNVALTRAKRVLRVVGDKRFFESLGGRSTLRALVAFADGGGWLHKSPVKRMRFCPPDWSLPTQWHITMTQRFFHCLHKMDQKADKNICLNTLFALALPDLKAIQGGKVAERMASQLPKGCRSTCCLDCQKGRERR